MSRRVRGRVQVCGCEPEDVRVRYHGREYRVVLGPPYFVEQRNGALMGSGMPTVNLADPETGEPCHGLTVEVPGAPLRPGRVLVGGGVEGLRVLTEAGVVRFTGRYFRSGRHDATFAVCDLLAGPVPAVRVRDGGSVEE